MVMMSQTQHSQVVQQIMDDLEPTDGLAALLHRALSHRSWINEQPDELSGQHLQSNERLEFLGDAVLGLVMANKLFELYPGYDEGQLSKLKSYLISSKVLTQVANRLGLGQGLLLGQGEIKTGGHQRASLIANSMEAVIGAIYLACGWAASNNFILKHWQANLATADQEYVKQDFKTSLQEITQRKYNELPLYRVVATNGPDHHKQFKVEVTVAGQLYGQGHGTSKKEAEQQAASAAIEKLG